MGDTAIWRRQPHQLQSTLAFMLGRDEGRLYKVPSWEHEDVKKCLRWLKEKNPHVRVLMTNMERFGNMYKRLQALVPQGRADASVRLQRTHRSSSAIESTLGDTIGSEESVLVVVDPKELPKTLASLDLFADSIGSATPRAPGETDRPPAERSHVTTAEASDAVRGLQESVKVTLGDWRLGAKMFPRLHPHGTVSLRSEEGDCSMSECLKNRLLLLEHEFRRSPVWSFAMMDRLIKNDL